MKKHVKMVVMKQTNKGGMAMMKLIGIALGGMLLQSVAFASNAKAIELVYANGYARTTISTGIIADEWIKAIEAATEGRVKIRHVHGGALIKPEVMVEGVKNGVADIGSVVIPFFPGQLPISATLASLVHLVDGNKLGPKDTIGIVQQLMAEHSAFKEEYDRLGLRASFWIAAPPYATIVTRPINKLDDFKGLKVRTFGDYKKILAAAGASPLSMSFSEVYTSLQTGVIDGCVTDIPAMAVNKLYEVGKHVVTWGPKGGAATAIPSIVFVFNNASWGKIPPADQQIIEKVSQEMLLVGAQRIVDAQAAAVDELLAQGVTITHLTEKETADLAERAGDFYAQAAEKMTNAGYPGAEIMKTYQKLVKQVIGE